MKKINTLELCTCLFDLIVSSFLGMGIYNILKISKENLIITLLSSMIIGVLFLYFFLRLFNYEKDNNLSKKVISLFGNKLSFVIIILLSICIIISAAVNFYDLNNFVISQYLSETPIIIIGILLSFLVLYINNKGIEVIARVSTIFFIINILLMIIPLFGEENRFSFNNFKPILKEGFIPIIKGIPYTIIYFITPIFTLLSIPKNNIVANEKTNKWIIFTYIISFLFMIGVSIFTIGILGYDLAGLYQYPSYMVLKRLKLFGFLDRIENIIILRWIFQVFISTSLMVYLINQLTKMKNYIIVLCILLLSLLLFKNNTFFNYFTIKILPFFLITILIVIIISNIILIFINKKKKA